MKTQTLSIQRRVRLQDLISLANHAPREQWNGLRCHIIPTGKFTATYSDLADRWSVSHSVAYSTIKALVKMGYISIERFEHSTLITILKYEVDHPESKDTLNSNVQVKVDVLPTDTASLFESPHPRPPKSVGKLKPKRVYKRKKKKKHRRHR